MSGAETEWRLYCEDSAEIDTAVACAIAAGALLKGVRRLGVAVSGGADSVALLHLLLPHCSAADINVTVLHFNHGLRAESAAEEHFVNSLATASGLPYRCGRAHLAERTPDGRSLEMAARDARLAFFNESAMALRLDAIATGHHADDLVESLLLRLARGSGAAGLSALRPVSPLPPAPGAGHAGAVPLNTRLIRPLLTVSSSALRQWLRLGGHAWHEDRTNLDQRIPRNLVRHTLLPQLEKIWPQGLRAALCRSVATLREDDALLHQLAAEQFARLRRSDPLADSSPTRLQTLEMTGLLELPLALQRRVLRLWLYQANLRQAAGLATVERLLDAGRRSDDWQLALPGGGLVRGSGGLLRVVQPSKAAPEPLRLSLPTTAPLRWGGYLISGEAAQGIQFLSNGIGEYPASCSIDPAKLRGRELLVRARRPGDRIAPVNMRGTRKVQDILVDAKVPAELRDSIPLLVCGAEVVWLPGYRVARAFALDHPDAPAVKITIVPAPPPE